MANSCADASLDWNNRNYCEKTAEHRGEFLNRKPTFLSLCRKTGFSLALIAC